MESCHVEHHAKPRPDYLLWASSAILLAAYAAHTLAPSQLANPYLLTFTASTVELLNRMAWGIVLGIIFVGILSKIPRDVVTSLLGKDGTFSGILRATFAGVMLDLCSHGILMVGAQLYKRGVSTGQVMAFLIASPWNSISLTLILWALVGFKWMATLLILSMIIAIISGLIFDRLVQKGMLPKNPNLPESHEECSLKEHFKMAFKNIKMTPSTPFKILKTGLIDSKMVLKWIFFGVVLAALVRTFLTPDALTTYFGPTMLGLGMTILIATIMEVCSEGSVPIAADLLTRAGAPGNMFAFLMTGVSTDYTEILVLKDAMKSLKAALFLPLVTVPQVLVIAWLLNQAAV